MPWSDAHLQVDDGFDRNFDTAAFKESPLHPWAQRHPNMHSAPGLKNVAGVYGNLLETPQVAGKQYRTVLQQKFGGSAPTFVRSDGSGELLPQPYSLDQVEAEFVSKHGTWHSNAMQNHKPIIGGMSGHTLGYLNLYKDAPKEAGYPADAPTMEYLRAITFAGLVGNKRHHSYDEVMAASTGIAGKPDDAPRSYRVKAGYNDVLQSTNSPSRPPPRKRSPVWSICIAKKIRAR